MDKVADLVFRLTLEDVLSWRKEREDCYVGTGVAGMEIGILYCGTACYVLSLRDAGGFAVWVSSVEPPHESLMVYRQIWELARNKASEKKLVETLRSHVLSNA